jgi:hypothetical protein
MELCPRTCADAIWSLPKSLIRRLILGQRRFWGFEGEDLIKTTNFPIAQGYIFDTVLPLSFATQTFAPSNATDDGASPVGKVPSSFPSLARNRVTLSAP